ncbi:MAG: DNA translocase FtsK, partial [Clostridia bacterium]|nr:DNA translocase FtsK [Clostridia bacterium]
PAESPKKESELSYLDDLIEKSTKKPQSEKTNLDEQGVEFDDASSYIPTDVKRKEAPKPAPPKKKAVKRSYKFPPIQFLQEPLDNADSEEAKAELQENARIIVDTLNNFKIGTKISDITRGPTVTRYELVPEAGVRVRSIAGLVDDIALNLAAEGIRIECPIPGKSAVGIEVPNKVTSMVYLRELIDSKQFKGAKGKLTCALGKSISGENIYVDIEKTPHLLVAGATGMGKSVCINSLLVSLLYRTTPDDVRLILIDPKKVELSNYNGVPHLLVPVVCEPKKSLGALQWAVTEMENRFETIEAAGVRNLIEFNEKVDKGYDADKMARIVIVIDELADLKMTVPDIEGHITRLTQKARAAGIHIIIGTQRPSVDVITGLIKSNIPSRISFRVPSQVDSRTILDEVGAEKLVSRGDMLVKIVGALRPARVQGSFVSADEIEEVINFWKENSPAIYDEDVMHQIDANAAKMAKNDKNYDDGAEGSPDDDGDLDSAFYEALELATEMGKISSSFLQRKLRLGFQRAARIIDQMEECGYIGEANGSKPRDVLITKEDYQEIMMRRSDD